MMTAIVMLPLMGALAVGVDYAEMSRQRTMALNALDAAGIGTARRYLEGNITTAQLNVFAQQFFAANAEGIDPSKVKLTLVLPDDTTGGGTLKLTADMEYSPYFLPVLTSMLGGNAVTSVDFKESSEVRLKNTLEVAMALDNSGSMSEKGGSSGTVRMDLLKAAAKQLVDTLAAEGNQMKQVEKPVQFSLVPFAASVNIGPANATATWMDLDGISPIHHENFAWSTMSSSYNATKYVQQTGGIWYKKGTGWGVDQNKPMTRFSLFKDIQRISGWNKVTSSTPGAQFWCDKFKTGSTTQCATGYTGYYRTPILSAYSGWKGCVEGRPNPYNVNDTAPTTTTPATLFVPLFAPDESDQNHYYNNWFTDVSTSTTDATRQVYMPKYYNTSNEMAAETASNGPNQPCTTTAITKLTDVTNATGLASIKASIDAMTPLGGTNVIEGMAWGWRTVTSGLPFTEGRAETERGNDKVLIVVTDGANTYYTPDSLSDGTAFSDGPGNKSIYSALGYAKIIQPTAVNGRIFTGTSTSISKTTYSNANYTNAMNEHFATLCNNAKAAKVMVMTVALDLNASVSAEATQINMLKACASESRFSTNADGTKKKLFWNSTGASLANDFKKIGNELSNLRIVG